MESTTGSNTRNRATGCCELNHFRFSRQEKGDSSALALFPETNADLANQLKFLNQDHGRRVTLWVPKPDCLYGHLALNIAKVMPYPKADAEGFSHGSWKHCFRTEVGMKALYYWVLGSMERCRTADTSFAELSF